MIIQYMSTKNTTTQIFNYKEDIPEKNLSNLDILILDNSIMLKELKEKRYSICKSCEYFDKNSKNCKKCSCFMPMKTLFVVATCPLEKW